MAVLARETEISFTELRLRDGSLVLKAKRGRRGRFEQSGKTSPCLGVELGHSAAVSATTPPITIATTALKYHPASLVPNTISSLKRRKY